VAEEDASSKWPDLTIALSFITAIVFLASLLFVFGLSQGLHHDLLGLCDLSDYLRVAPSWAIPTIGLIIYGTLLRWGEYRPDKIEGKKERTRKPFITFPSWWNHDVAMLVLNFVLGVTATILQARHSNSFWAWLSLMFNSTTLHLLSFRLLPGWIHLFKLPQSFAFFIPRSVLVLALSYWTGLYYLPLYGGILSFRKITMKDHSEYTGDVVLELSRYILVRNPEGKLTVLQSSEIQTMDLLNRPSTNVKTERSPAPKPSPQSKTP
jgi:hypothetical protein